MMYQRVVLAVIVAALPSIRAFGSLPNGGVTVGAESADDPCEGVNANRYYEEYAASSNTLHVILDKGDETPCNCYTNLVEKASRSACGAAGALLKAFAGDTDVDGTLDLNHKSLTESWEKSSRPAGCFMIENTAMTWSHNKVYFNERLTGANAFTDFRKICGRSDQEADACNELGTVSPSWSCGTAIEPIHDSTCNIDKSPGYCSNPGDSCACAEWNNDAPRGPLLGGCPVCKSDPTTSAKRSYTYQKVVGGDELVGWHTDNQCCTWTPTPNLV